MASESLWVAFSTYRFLASGLCANVSSASVISLGGEQMRLPQVWWCNQGRTWNEESEAKVVCAAEVDAGRGRKYRSLVGEARKGDLVVHYVTTKGQSIYAVSRALEDGYATTIDLAPMLGREPKLTYGDGWMFKAEYWLLPNPLPVDEVRQQLVALSIDDGPFIRTGHVRRAYFMRFCLAGLRIIRGASGGTWPTWANRSLDRDYGLGARATQASLNRANADAENRKVFDPQSTEDARKRIDASIVARRGQAAFRQKLLDAYGRRCAITQTDAVEALEAAHIVPYRGPDTNSIVNGILLRADIHTLFDLGLISIDVATMTVLVSPALRRTSYGEFDGKPLATPKLRSESPSKQALVLHRARARL